MAAVTSRRSRERCVTGNASTTAVNTGTIILPPFSGSYIITGGWLRALGGSAGTVTTVNVSDTTGTPVVGCAVVRGNLTQDAVASLEAASGVTRTTFGTAFAAGKGIQLIKAGSAMDTATSIDYCIKYMKVNG